MTYFEKKKVLVTEKTFEIQTEGQEVAKFLKSLEQFIWTVKSYLVQFFNQNAL